MPQVVADQLIVELQAKMGDFNTRLAQAEQNFDNLTGSVQKNANVIEGRFRKAGDSLNKTLQGTKVNTANVAAQFNDIGVQLASGQSPFMIALQQGTQLNQILGPLGLRSAVASLGTAFVSMINPLSLLTIATITLGGAAVQYFSSVLSDGTKSSEELEKQAGVVHRVADEWGDAFPAIKAYSDELKEAKKQADLLAAQQNTLADRSNNVADSAKELNSALTQVALNSGGFQQLAQFTELFGAIDDYIDAAKEGKDVTETLSAVQKELADALATDVVQGSDDARAAIGKLAASMKILGEVSSEFFGGKTGRLVPSGQDAITDRLDAAQEQFDFLRRFNERLQGESLFDFPDDDKKDTERDKEARQIERQKERLADYIAQQTLELSLLESTNAERKIAVALRRFEGVATEEDKKQIRDVITATEEWKEANKNNEQAIRDFNRIGRAAVGGLINDLMNGKSAAESFANALSRVGDMLLNIALNDIFGGGGSGGGGFLGGLLGSIFPGNAYGTDNWRGGPTWVGEHGKELVNLPAGTSITPANQVGGTGQIVYSPVYNVAQGADPKAIAELRKAQAEDRAQFNSNVLKSINDARKRNRF